MRGNTFASITSHNMKTEEHAWQALRDHASAQLHTGFAERVLRSAHGPQAETWAQLQSHASRQLRPGFAERVLRAAREIPGVPSFVDHFALSVGTAAFCAAAVFFIHDQSSRREDERNLARWQQIAKVVVAEDPDL